MFPCKECACGSKHGVPFSGSMPLRVSSQPTQQMNGIGLCGIASGCTAVVLATFYRPPPLCNESGRTTNIAAHSPSLPKLARAHACTTFAVPCNPASVAFYRRASIDASLTIFLLLFPASCKSSPASPQSRIRIPRLSTRARTFSQYQYF